jgi:signal transduction histidine kinase
MAAMGARTIPQEACKIPQITKDEGVAEPDTLESERARLAEAERRQRILSDVSRILLDYVGPDEVEPLRRIVALVTQELGDWCAFSLVQPDGTMKNVAAHHPDPRQRELQKKLAALVPPARWDAGPPEYNSLLQRKPVVIEEITDQMLRASVPSEEVYQLYKEVGMSSAVVAPMFDGRDPLGTLALVATGRARRYLKGDVDFVFSLAGRAALAVRNARLVGEIARERDRQKTARIESDRRVAELQAVFNAVPNGLALFDAEGRLQFASPRLEDLFGIPLGTMLGQPWPDIYRRKLAQVVSLDRDKLFARVEQIFHDKWEKSLDELELERPRHRYVTRQSTPVVGADGGYLGRLLVYTDVSEQRELDRQRSDFLTVAAHELRTPLTPLSMYLQNIERHLQRGHPVNQEMVGKAKRQVGRMGKLVEDLLDVSRLESRRLHLDMEDVDLNDLADQVVADFRAESRNHEVVLHRLHEPLLVRGDRARLEQVLVNVLSNALKYSPQGGQVVVRLSRSQGEASVSVTDPGIGIPPDEQPHLFQRFFRAANATTRNYSGLGIGLHVSNEIVRAHAGRFEVKSALGAGSTFTFHLPLSAAAPAPVTRARVLLVDDDPEILEATSQLLREWGYAVDEARDGATALSLARDARPDLMLVDLMMPVMDGWTLIRRMREEELGKGVPVVVFSADSDAREKAKALDADAALRKPFELQELQDVVERLLARKPAA